MVAFFSKTEAYQLAQAMAPCMRRYGGAHAVGRQEDLHRHVLPHEFSSAWRFEQHSDGQATGEMCIKRSNLSTRLSIECPDCQINSTVVSEKCVQGDMTSLG